METRLAANQTEMQAVYLPDASTVERRLYIILLIVDKGTLDNKINSARNLKCVIAFNNSRMIYVSRIVVDEV
jgi:hypothetical protein